MKYIIGNSRNQISMSCLDDLVSQDNQVRLIDMFVDSLPLADFGFEQEKDLRLGGRPAYHPGDLLKLYIYGHLNRIQSSRLLEKECNRNIELRWLMHELVPDHNTISNTSINSAQALDAIIPKLLKKYFGQQ